MSVLRRCFILIAKDFSEFFTSKAWIVVLILPLFITFLYTVIYRQAESKIYTIAYPPGLNKTIRTIFSDPHIRLKHYQNVTAAKNDLAKGKVDGVILNHTFQNGEIRLLVDKSRVGETAILIDVLNIALLRIFAQDKIPIIKPVYLNQSISPRWVSLPTWLIQVILTICLLQASAAIADEKDRQSLHSLLVSPMTFTDYLLAKIIWNAVIGTGAILLTLILTQASINWGVTVVFGLLGCLVYSAIAILIGLFTPGALFARTIATLTYIISALPMMIKELSFPLKGILNICPSYLILQGLEQALPVNPAHAILITNSGGILIETGLIYGVAYLALKFKSEF